MDRRWRRRRRDRIHRVRRHPQSDHLSPASPSGAADPRAAAGDGRRFGYHAIVTNHDGDLLELEADHRRHAVVEHVISDLKRHAGLAHLPSGRFAANAAWLTLVGTPYNVARSTARAAGLGRVTTKALRLTIIAAPVRLVHRSR